MVLVSICLYSLTGRYQNKVAPVVEAKTCRYNAELRSCLSVHKQGHRLVVVLCCLTILHLPCSLARLSAVLLNLNDAYPSAVFCHSQCMQLHLCCCLDFAQGTVLLPVSNREGCSWKWLLAAVCVRPLHPCWWSVVYASAPQRKPARVTPT